MESVSEYQHRKLSRKCTYRGCTKPPADGSNDCDEHGTGKRARNRRHMAKKRKKWAAAGLCKVCGRVRRKGSPWGCMLHDPVVDAAVDNKRDRVAANTTPRTTASNLGRVHYHGHGQRGRVSNALLDAQDLGDAKRELVRAEGELAYAYSPEVQEMPRIQGLDEKRKAVSRVYLGVKFLLEVLDRHGENVIELLIRDGLIRE